MQSFTKRALSLMLALILCVGVLSGIRLPVSAANTVDYVYGSPTEISKYTNVIYNWGTRGEVATFLSPNAEAFYTGKNVTYSELSKLSGSSNTDSVPSSALYQALNDLVTDAQAKTTSYDDTRYLFRFTDCQGSALTDDSISCFYSGNDIGPEWDSGSTWNREHTWPNSKGDANGNGENDIMMLRPTSSNINSSRGNKAYGEETTTSYYNPNNEAGGNYDVRGDVARVVLYVYTRWGTENMWGASGVIESKEVLLKWMAADPVDTWEMGRNDSVESITGTRNVYVDYPELAFLLFNEEVPAMQTPSGGDDVVVTPPSYTVTAVSNNVNYGTVSISDKVITATPKTGCYVDGYTVTSGTATVVQNGNVFTVTPTSNCTVQINFAQTPVVPDPPVIPDTPVNGVQVMAHNVYFDDYLQIMYAVYVPEGKTIDKIVLSDGTNEFKAVPFDDGTADPVISGKTCQRYVASSGVALQNIDTVVTASVYVDGEVATTDEYSIMQYLHKRLIVSKPDANQRAMYEKLLYAAEKLQVVLNKGTVTLHNTSYVHVINGTVGGKTEAMLEVGKAIGTVAPAVAPGENQQIVWTVTAYTDTGVASEPVTKTTEQVQEMVVENGVNLVLEAAVSDSGSGGGTELKEYTAKISFATASDRNSASTSQQVWSKDGVVFTYNKGSGSNLNDTYINPLRLYANTNLEIKHNEGYQITKIVFEASSTGNYVTYLKNSITTGTVTTSGKLVTVTFDEPIDVFTIAKITSQTRINYVEVTYLAP